MFRATYIVVSLILQVIMLVLPPIVYGVSYVVTFVGIRLLQSVKRLKQNV